MAMKTFDLTDKAIVVTGAARGLGREMTLALAKAGAHIVAADILTEQNEETAAAVRALGRRARRRARLLPVRRPHPALPR